MMLPSHCASRLVLLRRTGFTQTAPWIRKCYHNEVLTIQRPYPGGVAIRFVSSSKHVSSNKKSNIDRCSNPPSNEKQQWMTATDCLSDHAEVWTRLPSILGAYIGPNQLPAPLAESIMVAVNSKNNCPYCEGLHGELARMAGVEDHKKLQAAASVEECSTLVRDPAIAFARTFANHHRGEESPEALEMSYDKVRDAHGLDKAHSVEGLCWLLTWGSLGGNTVNSVLWEGQRGVFPVVFTVYYGPLFGVIAVMNKGLALMPKMPGIFFQAMGVTLTVTAGIWMTPVGLLGLSKKMMGG